MGSRGEGQNTIQLIRGIEKEGNELKEASI